MCRPVWQSVIIILVTCILFTVRADTYAECNSPDKFNLYVASQTNCAHYIYCDGKDSFRGECLDDNYFNEVAGNCDDRETVVCKVGVINTEFNNHLEITTSVSFGEPSTTSKIPTFTTQLTTLSPANISPTQTTNNIFAPIQQSGNGAPQCPRSSDPSNTIYLPNARTCSAYYICHFGIAIPMSCPAQYYFNSLSGRCERQELVQCAVSSRC